MSYAPSTLADCPDLQAELNSYYQTCDASNLREPMPFFDFIMSPSNRGGIEQVISPGNGKIRTVILRYDQRINESSVHQGGCGPVCTATTKRGDLTHEVPFDPCNSEYFEELMTAKDWMYACRSNRDIITGKIQRMIDALVRRMATRLTNQAATLLGGWNSLVSPLTGTCLQVNTIKAGTTADVNPNAYQDISFALMQSNFCGQAGIFGGPTLYKYMQTVMNGCCSNQGVDVGLMFNQFGLATMYDKRVTAAQGDNVHGWALMLGALQAVTYNEATGYNELFEGAGGTVGKNYEMHLINDPSSGLPIDLIISDNCGNVSIVVKANVQVTALPTDMYSPSDEMAGVTGFACIKVVNA